MTPTQTSARGFGARASAHQALIGFSIGLVLGVASLVHATVACGSFDRTVFTLVSVRKNGVAQALPARVQGYVTTDGADCSLVDPDTGNAVSVSAKRTVTP